MVSHPATAVCFSPQTAEERDLSLLLNRALEPSVQCHTFPKAVVDVYVTILESGGSVRSPGLLMEVLVCSSRSCALSAVFWARPGRTEPRCCYYLANQDLAVAVSAASVALAIAGVELYDLVAACRVVRFRCRSMCSMR